MPSHKSKAYSTMCRRKKKQLNALIKKVQHTFVIVDIWFSRDRRSYFGITGHFILNFELHTVVLSCKRFTGKHTTENIFQIIRPERCNLSDAKFQEMVIIRCKEKLMKYMNEHD